MQEWLKLVVLALKVSIVLQVVAIGLGTSWSDATHLFTRPRLLWNSVLARNIAVPIIAILLIKTFSFHGVVAITLAVLSVTPVPPLLPKSELKGGARSKYVLGLLTSQSLLAIVLVPITIILMDWALGGQARFGAAPVATLVVQMILIPLAVGMLASKLFPQLGSVAPHLMMVGTVLLIAGAIPLLPLGWKTFGALVGGGGILAMIIFVIAGTAVGYLLGGPRPEDRATLAAATSSRHPGLALAIAHVNFPDQTGLVAGAVMIYLIVRILVLIPLRRLAGVAMERGQTSPHGTYRPTH
jgi:BASS family bile acid:Na+ symporter